MKNDYDYTVLERPQRLTRQIQSSALIKHNAIFFVGAISMGLINYLFYPVLSRILEPTAFGEVQALASLFLQLGICLGVLGLLTVNIVTNYNNETKRNRIISELERLAVFIGAVFLVIFIVLSGSLKDFFHFGSVWPFIILALAVFVSVPLTFRNGYLRGRQQFGLVSRVGIFAAAADLVLAAILALLGFSTTGVMAALVIAQALTFMYAAALARRHGFTESLRQGSLLRLPDLRLILPELKYALLVLVGSLAITAMYSLDIIVVKHYFDARTAGLYAGISTVARIIFFLTASVAQVLMPAIKLQQSAKENRQILGKSILILVSIGGAALLSFTILPHLIVRILMGGTYAAYADLLPRLSLAIFVISLVNLFIMYYLALRRYVVALIVIAGLALTLLLINLNHATLAAVINSLLYGSLAMLAIFGIWTGTTKIKER